MRFGTCSGPLPVRETWISLAAVVRRDALLALTRPVTFATRWFSPVIGIGGFYFVATLVDPHHSLHVDGRREGYFAYVSINLSFMMLQSSALQAIAQTIRSDQVLGTLEPILATPTRTSLFVASCGVWPIAVSVAQVAFSLAVASAFMGLNLRATDIATLAVFGVLSTLTMFGLGMLGAAGVITFKQVPPSGYLVGGAGSLLAGTLFPVALLPLPLQAVSWCLPLTHALAGLRAAVAGDPVAGHAADAVWLAIAAAILLPLSFFALSRAVARARADGTLAQY